MRGESTQRDAGNTLVLFPAVMLVLLSLLALALDAATAYTAQRRLADLASAVATDAVASLDVDAYYRGEELRFDPAAVVRRAQQIRALVAEDRGLHDTDCSVTLAGSTVSVTCTGRVRRVIGPLRDIDLGATAVARAAER